MKTATGVSIPTNAAGLVKTATGVSIPTNAAGLAAKVGAPIPAPAIAATGLAKLAPVANRATFGPQMIQRRPGLPTKGPGPAMAAAVAAAKQRKTRRRSNK